MMDHGSAVTPILTSNDVPDDTEHIFRIECTIFLFKFLFKRQERNQSRFEISDIYLAFYQSTWY